MAQWLLDDAEQPEAVVQHLRHLGVSGAVGSAHYDPQQAVAAEPSVLLKAAMTMTTAVSRAADRSIQVRQTSAERPGKQEQPPYNVARAGMTE
ncbi:MAG: hypothetical protein M3Z28_14615 [Candidatus Dormibacteraeota bacterium]|nr:hypothetical protein [Candidatus Dormibacteraeota bacterium]